MLEKHKTKVIVTKWRITRERISFSSTKEHKKDSGNDINLSQADKKYLLPL